MSSPAPPQVGTVADREPSREFEASRVDAEYSRLPVTQFTAVVNAVALALAFRSTLGRPILVWLAVVAVVAVLRLPGWALHRRHPRALSPRGWANAQVMGAGVNGLLWGLIPLLAFGHLGLAERLVAGAILVGMVAASAYSNFGHPAAFAAFAAPVLTPLLIRLFASPSPLERAAGAVGGVVAVAMGTLSRTAARNLRASVTQRLRNDALIERLSAAREELTEVNAGLEETVRQRTADLMEMERQLSHAALLASVGSLAAGVAHDINSPLASLLGNVGVLEQEAAAAAAPPSPAAREALADVRACAERVRVTVRSLREVARADGQRGPLELREVVHSCLEVAHPELRGRVRVARELRESGRVLAERGSLSQVVLGLVLHMGRRVPAREPPRHELRVTIHGRRGQVVALEVVVEPPPPEADGDDGPVADATRLLLSLCHASVVRLGGSIVERDDRSGFVVTLPRAGTVGT